MKLWDYIVCQQRPWLVDNYVVFYPSKEETKRNVVIGSTSLHASHDTAEANKGGPQSMQENITTQIGKCKRAKKVDIPHAPQDRTTSDATCTSTPMDIDKFLSNLHQDSVVIQQPTWFFSFSVQVLLDYTFALGLISIPSHSLLLKTCGFVNQISIHIIYLMIQ